MSTYDDIVIFLGETFLEEQFSEILKDSKKLSKLIKRAATVTEVMAIVQDDRKLSRELRQHSKTISKVGKEIGKVASYISKARNIYLIYIYTKELDAETIRDYPEESAKVLGALFYQLGELAELLPPPANAYAKVLKIAKEIFVGLQVKLNPVSPKRDRGRDLLKIMDDDEALFAPR